MITIPYVVPGGGLLAAAGRVWATIWAEVAMQWRRLGLWVTFACVTGLLLLLSVQAAIYLFHLPQNSLYVRLHFTQGELNNVMLYGATAYGAMFFGIVAALLVVDRLRRDYQLGMVELQRATPLGHMCYVLGKFLGNYVAVLVPMFLGYLLCMLVPILLGWPVVLLPMYLLVFLLIFIPSSLAAVGLTFLLASFLPVRIVQISFSLLWFYLDIGIGWHGLAFTIFNPSGLYVYPVFFPTRLPSIPGIPSSSLSLALLNIAVLLLTAFVALFLTCGSLAFQQHRAEVS